MSAPRIAIGGFLHETNTFAPTKATYQDFVQGGGWPAMAEGTAIAETIRDINVGISGFIAQAEAFGWELVPTLWCAASPSAHVDKEAYERIATAIVDGIAGGGRRGPGHLDHHRARLGGHLDPRAG
ncbi:MAG: M81 family metallopeptidase, partial [Xanthobacteraceae bacterium]|nr:M81 family metallopeptidase [Xanthobacteraceae bacterium]